MELFWYLFDKWSDNVASEKVIPADFQCFMGCGMRYQKLCGLCGCVSWFYSRFLYQTDLFVFILSKLSEFSRNWEIGYFCCCRTTGFAINLSRNHLTPSTMLTAWFLSLWEHQNRSEIEFSNLRFWKLSDRTICRKPCERRHSHPILRKEDLLMLNSQELLELSKNIYKQCQ